MLITNYRVIHSFMDWGRPIGDANGSIPSGVTPVDILILETDEGIEGIALGTCEGIEKVFLAVHGEDPRSAQSLYDRLLAVSFKAGHGGSTYGVIGTIDSAIWDLKARAAGEPLWRLLGGRSRFITAYASGVDISLSDEELAEYYLDMGERGFSVGKLKGGNSIEDDTRRLSIAADQLHAGSGKRAVMALDANERWSVAYAQRYLSALSDQFDLAWIEEPLRRWDWAGFAQLATRTKFPLATGENLDGLEHLRGLLECGGVAIAQAGSHAGVTHYLRAGIMASCFDVPVSLVGATGNPATAHVSAALPNHLTTEVQSIRSPWGIRSSFEFINGGIELNTEPGNGLLLDPRQVSNSHPEIAGWASEGSPHRRDPRAGLEISLDSN